MAELKDVKKYVQKTADIIGTVSELEVLICDSQLRILGDSKRRSGKMQQRVGAQSVLTAAIKERRIIALEDAKNQAPGCRSCPDREECDVTAIIAVPVARGQRVYGGIGIYAYREPSVRRLMEKDSAFVEFIQQMAGLLMGKLDEEQQKAKLKDRLRKLSNHGSEVSLDHILGSSQAILKAKQEAENVAGGVSNVLIQGESGTGKEIFARAIHSLSPYAEGPFVAVNCAAIPDNLLESEWFGYEEGAFTGALKGGRIGKFELANHGTLFLDEVGEIPLHLQPKLLRAIQERRIQKLGGNQDLSLDIRILAATNRDLEEMMKGGAFREDLYYRLSVIPLHIPPLRCRQGDVRELCGYFLRRYGASLGKELTGFHQEALEILERYRWPGNVRELQNAVEYAVNMAPGPTIGREHLPARLLSQGEGPAVVLRPLKEVEEEYIREALRIYGDHGEGKEKAAKALGLSRATMYRRAQALNE